jgi:hypothetical protein
MIMACLVVVLVLYLVRFHSVHSLISSFEPVLSSSLIDDKVALSNTVRNNGNTQL